MLQHFHRPSLRNRIALDWLNFNQKKCTPRNFLYILNSTAIVLGTANTLEIKVLTWGLRKPNN